jgi:hypothetical protein
MSVYAGTIEVKILSGILYNQLGFSNDAIYGSYIAGTLIPQAQKIVDNHCNHHFGSYSGTFSVDGSGHETLVMPTQYCPLIAVTSVILDGANITGDVNVYDQFLVYDGVFTSDEQNVEVVTSYGYTSVPADIEYVTAELCAGVLRQLVRSKMVPDLIAPLLSAGANPFGLSAILSSPKVFTDEMKALLEPYVIQQVESFSYE